ncbi:hypothetical protein PoB_002591300 [Plakobranchus ocellatus]|uniref:Uncharacterized protein n=1 Tax=Plakobranchus ocellatus TaxID=259542 RepID=A0AAV3ZX27_9GAST|nr:hypothetical protein PoB_002591300 [Plakobranchus ocellatus]
MRYYYRTARRGKICVGDKILILLPFVSKKLLMQWKGPSDHPTVCWLLTLMITVSTLMEKRRLACQSLKKYITRGAVSNEAPVDDGRMPAMSLAVVEESSGYEVLPELADLDSKEQVENLKLGDELLTEQRRELKELASCRVQKLQCGPQAYGPGCKLSCSPFCVKNLCDSRKGKCLIGCTHGFEPANCDFAGIKEKGPYKKDSNITDSFDDPLHLRMLIVVSIVATVIIFVLSLGIFFVADISGHKAFFAKRNAQRDHHLGQMDLNFYNFDNIRSQEIVSPLRSTSWGSNICDAGDDVQSISNDNSFDVSFSFVSDTDDDNLQRWKESVV